MSTANASTACKVKSEHVNQKTVYTNDIQTI